MMTIVRIDAEARWPDVVIHNNTLYYTGVPENLDASFGFSIVSLKQFTYT